MNYTMQLREMGIGRGDTVLVHSSMKAIGTRRPPEEILDVLQQALGDEGTLLLPALTYANVTPRQPVFESRATQPCIGLLPRTFFGLKGVVRSIHPTHSVCARGRHAAALVAGHERDETPVGPNSPFMKLPDYGGKLLFIGDLLANCTFVHGVEEIAGTDYTLTEQRIRYVVDGEECYLYGHDFQGWESRYERIAGILAPGEHVTGAFGEARCHVVDAGALREKALKALCRDMHYFVTPRG